MPDILRVTFPYSAAEHAAALSEATQARRTRWFIRFCATAIGAGGVLVTVAGATVGRQPIVPLLQNCFPLIALGAFWYWGAPALLLWITARQLRREGIENTRGSESLSFSDVGFSPSPEWPQPIPWSFVDRVVETQRFFLIYHGYSKDPCYVPKHALTTELKERLVDSLTEHFKSHPNQLRLLGHG